MYFSTESIIRRWAASINPKQTSYITEFYSLTAENLGIFRHRAMVHSNPFTVHIFNKCFENFGHPTVHMSCSFIYPLLRYHIV